MRRLTFAVFVALLLVVGAPVYAGGSWLEPSAVRVEPGETLTLSGRVSRGQLGWVDDGPYFAYLSGESTVVVTSGLGGGKTDIPLGELLMERIDSNNMHVSVEVTVPADIAPGEYWVTHCNDPCTEGFGDLVGALLFVGMDPTDIGGNVATTDDSTTTSTTVQTASKTTSTTLAPTTTTEASAATSTRVESASGTTTATTAPISTTTIDTNAAFTGEASGLSDTASAAETSPSDRNLQLVAASTAVTVCLGSIFVYRRRRA